MRETTFSFTACSIKAQLWVLAYHQKLHKSCETVTEISNSLGVYTHPGLWIRGLSPWYLLARGHTHNVDIIREPSRLQGFPRLCCVKFATKLTKFYHSPSPNKVKSYMMQVILDILEVAAITVTRLRALFELNTFEFALWDPLWLSGPDLATGVGLPT